jgi:Na+-translocating ferredoxin:NAD+ oxidoreductase RnfD subunit
MSLLTWYLLIGFVIGACIVVYTYLTPDEHQYKDVVWFVVPAAVLVWPLIMLGVAMRAYDRLKGN